MSGEKEKARGCVLPSTLLKTVFEPVVETHHVLPGAFIVLLSFNVNPIPR
jgi:hypothetical protein